MFSTVTNGAAASATPSLSAPVSERFPRAARVRKRSEFTCVFDDGRRFAHPLLSLHWLRDEQPARLGLAVSRKVDPHAVGRNRIKRVLRDAFRRARLQLATGAYVVVARHAAAKADGTILRAALRSVLQRAGALTHALPEGGAPGTIPAAGLHLAERQDFPPPSSSRAHALAEPACPMNTFLKNTLP